MNLIKIENKEGKQVVSARELYDFLGFEKANWKRWYSKNIVEEEFFQEGVDYDGFVLMMNGNETKDFVITTDMAKELAMLSRTEKGKEARRYFIECENKLKSKQVPTTYLEALKEIIKIEEEKVELQSKVGILTHVNKLYTSTEIAKELGMKSATELNRKLADLKVQYKVNNTWVLTAKYSNLGYESIKQTVLDAGKVIYDRKFSQLGRDFILELLGGNVWKN